MATKLFLLLFLSVILDSTVQKTYQIHPGPCKSGNCFTFADYANDSKKYFISNSIFQFFSGIHTLKSKLLIKDAYNISFVGDDSSSLILSSNNSLQWSGCTNVTLNILEFRGNISVSSTLKFSDCHQVSLINITVHKLNGIIVFNSTVDIFNCKIYNGSSFVGGAISVHYSNLSFYGQNVFDSNKAESGGAIYINNSILLLGDNNMFKNNLAGPGSGGSVYAKHSNITLLGDNSFSNQYVNMNSLNFVAKLGGAIAVVNGTLILKTNVSFLNNAARYGGAMYLKNCQCEVSGSAAFLCNSAYFGGAMFMRKTNCYLHGKVIIKNNSARNGGGVYIIRSSLYFYEMTTIQNNNAADRGGGLVVEGSSVSIYNNIQIKKNTASRGGGIFLKEYY